MADMTHCSDLCPFAACDDCGHQGSASHDYADPACVWRARQGRTDAPAVGPGDRVHLCTAPAVWPVAAVHDDQTVTLGARDGWTQPMRVHRAHLDPEPDQHDGQTTIYDHMEDQCSR